MRFCRVMSRAIVETPTTFPAASKIGEIVTETSRSAPVLVEADRLAMLDALARLHASEDLRQFIGAIGGYDRGDVLVHHLGGRVSVELLGATIPAQDCSIEALRHDRIVGRFHDCGQELDRCVPHQNGWRQRCPLHMQ